MKRTLLFVICICFARLCLALTVAEALRLRHDDLYLGAKDAKVTVVEYASVSCPYCALYKTTVFPSIKKEYIDTGKILYIVRDHPVNRPGVMGTMLAYCSGDYFLYQKTLMESQSMWAYRTNYVEMLSNIAKLGGMTDEQIKACFADTSLHDRIIQSNMEAARLLGIHAIPTLFIGGKKYIGALSYAEIKGAIDKALQ